MSYIYIYIYICMLNLLTFISDTHMMELVPLLKRYCLNVSLILNFKYNTCTSVSTVIQGTLVECNHLAQTRNIW